MTRFNLEEHLAREHRRTPFARYLPEIVYGGNDGIVTTFAVVAGFAGAQADPSGSVIPLAAVLLFGLANLFADGVSMSLGSFLSLRADRDVFASERSKEAHEITHDPDNEYAETVEILRRKHFSETDAHAIAGLYRKNPAYWTEFMMKDELEMANPEHENPVGVALATFFSFVGFGGIPLVPFMLFPAGRNHFTYALVFTGAAMFLLGLLRTKVTQRKALLSIFETLTVGGLSAVTAYGVGLFFRV